MNVSGRCHHNVNKRTHAIAMKAINALLHHHIHVGDHFVHVACMLGFQTTLKDARVMPGHVHGCMGACMCVCGQHAGTRHDACAAQHTSKADRKTSQCAAA